MAQVIEEHDPVALARIYRIAFLTLQDPVFRILTTPLQHTHEYLDTTKPITFAWREAPHLDWNRFQQELTLFWVRMWDVYGLVTWNFHLYLQSDGRVAITELEQTGFLHWDDTTGKRTKYWISMPCNVSLPHFFSLSTFPDGFLNTIKDIEGVSPVFRSSTMTD